MLIVDSLEHAYGMERVLYGVFLRCNPGEVIGVVGRNGCGKTTMLKSLFGSLAATHMHLEIDGSIIEHAYHTGLVEYLPQEPYLPRRLRVRRAVSLSLPDAASRAALRADPFTSTLFGKRIKALSGGEQRYLEVLLVSLRNASYVFLDEPFTEIEPIHRVPLRATIRRIAKEHNRGFVITDHAYRDVLECTDRVVVLVDGVMREASGEEDLRRWGYTP
jgi:ABC-type multidrug transport system ATPase subunit